MDWGSNNDSGFEHLLNWIEQDEHKYIAWYRYAIADL